jgi:hypothetical protein
MLAELARVKAIFQQRAIMTHLTGKIQPMPNEEPK